MASIDPVQQILHIGNIHQGITVGIILGGEFTAAQGAEGNGRIQLAGSLTHKLNVLDGNKLIGQGGAVQCIGMCFLREVIYVEGEAVHTMLFIVITKGDLGGQLIAIVGSQIYRAADGSVGIGRTGSLLSGGIQHAAGLHNRDGSAHDESLCHRVKLAVCKLRMLLPQILQHQGGHTGNVGGRHGGTTVHAVLAIVQGRVDVAAGGGHIRHELQISGHTPGGEFTDLTGIVAGAEDHLIQAVNRQGALSVHGSGDHHLTVSLGDTHVGQQTGVLHIDQLTVHIVIDNTGDGTSRVSVLLLVCKVKLTATDQRDLAGKIQPLIVSFGAVIGDHHIGVGAAGQAGEGLGGGIAVGYILVTNGEIVAGNGAVFQACHHGSAGIGGGRGDDTIVDIPNHIQIRAPSVHVGSGGGVTGRDGGNHVALMDLSEDGIRLRGVAGKAGGGAKAHVHRVHIQNEAVLQTGQNIIKLSGSGGAEHLHDNELGIGRNTNGIGILHPVGGGNTGNMGAMVTLTVMIMGGIQIHIRVVKSKGNLPAVVYGFGAQTQNTGIGSVSVGLRQNLSQLLFGQRALRQRRLSSKGRMIQVQAGIHNGDSHSLTGETGLPGLDGAKLLPGGIGVRGNRILGLRQAVSGRHKRPLNTLHLANLLQSAVGNFYCHTTDNNMVMIANFHGCIQVIFAAKVINYRLNGVGHIILTALQSLRLCSDLCPSGGNLRFGEAPIQQRRILQDHNDGNHFVIGINLCFQAIGQLCVTGLLQGFVETYIRFYLIGSHVAFRLSRVCQPGPVFLNVPGFCRIRDHSVFCYFAELAAGLHGRGLAALFRSGGSN